MIDPVDMSNFFIAFFSAAMVILMGAAYALFFTLAKLNSRRLFMFTAYLSYTLLAVSVFLLAEALNLEGYWHTIVWLMLIGYLLAPHGIWHLCRGTHVASHETANARTASTTQTNRGATDKNHTVSNSHVA